MASRMQAYRARMKARGLMQVTVWAKPDDAAAIRAFSQQLLDDEAAPPLAASAPLTGTPDDSPTIVTGDHIAPPAPPANAMPDPAATTPLVTGDAPDSDISAMPDGPSAEALAEVAAEVANWDAELEDVDELQRHEEVLQELRLWLKELDGNEPDIHRAIEQVLNTRRKRVKQLKRKRR